MSYLGYTMLKSEFDNDKALEVAAWCNETQSATWQDMGDYYECVEVVEDVVHAPTLQEKIEQLNADYESARFELGKYYMEAFLDGDVDSQKELKTELDNVKAQYNADLNDLMNE